MDPLTITALLAAILGSGGLATVLTTRAKNRRTNADTRRIDVGSGVSADMALQERYDRLFDDLQIEVGRLRGSELECRATLETTIRSMAELRLVAVNAQAAVTLLQDRLDRLEDNDIPRRQETVREVMRQLHVTNPEDHK